MEFIKSRAKKCSASKRFENDSHGAHSEAEVLGLAPLRHAKGFNLEVLKSSAKTLRVENFGSDSHGAHSEP